MMISLTVIGLAIWALGLLDLPAALFPLLTGLAGTAYLRLRARAPRN
jgi:hypothetical protein